MRKKLEILSLLVLSWMCLMALGTMHVRAFSVDITPETLNLGSQASYLTAYIEQSILFKDEFANPTWTTENWHKIALYGQGEYTVEDGQYSGQGGWFDFRSESLAGSEFTPVEAYNFVLDVKATTLVYGWSDYTGGTDAGANIPFRYLDHGHMVNVGFRHDRVTFAVEQGIDNPWYGVCECLMDVGFTQHYVRIVANGDNYWVYVDDMVTPKIAVNFPLEGVGDGLGLGTGIGVWAYSNAHVHYDDFVLKEYMDDSTVDVSTLKIWYKSSATADLSYIADALSEPTQFGDYDGDSLKDTMVKFDRAAIITYLQNQGVTSGEIELVVTGKADGIDFSGGDTIRVLAKGKAKVSS